MTDGLKVLAVGNPRHYGVSLVASMLSTVSMAKVNNDGDGRGGVVLDVGIWAPPSLSAAYFCGCDFAKCEEGDGKPKMSPKEYGMKRKRRYD